VVRRPPTPSESEVGEPVGPSPCVSPALPSPLALEHLEEVLLARPLESCSPGFSWACLRWRTHPKFAALVSNSDYNSEACGVILAVWKFSSVQPLGVFLFIKQVDFL